MVRRILSGQNRCERRLSGESSRALRASGQGAAEIHRQQRPHHVLRRSREVPRYDLFFNKILGFYYVREHLLKRP